MMGAPVGGVGGAGSGGGKQRKRQKFSMTAAQRSKEERALLGPAPRAVPGVIGAWARQEE